MRGLSGEAFLARDSRDREDEDLEERVANWLARHNTLPTIWSVVLVFGALIALVAFAALR
jgi:hypothetical protein